MEFDRSICKIREEADLPCQGCAFYGKCTPKKKKVVEKKVEIQENTPQVLKKRTRKTWTIGDIAVMSNPEYTSVEAAEIIGRNKYTVIKWRQRNNIKTPIGRRKK